MNTFKDAQEAFNTLYGSLIIPVLLFDEKSRLIKVNKSFLEITKTDVKDLPLYTLSTFFKRFPDGISHLESAPEKYVTEITSFDGKEIPIIMHYIKRILLKNIISKS